MTIRLSTLACAAAVLLSACQMSTTPEHRRVVGILEWVRTAPGSSAGRAAAEGSRPPEMVVAPDTVQAGVPFTAVITTIGFDSCWDADGASIESNPQLAVVTPYDRYSRSEEQGCLTMHFPLQHAVQVTFTQPGEAILRVNGRKVSGQDFESGTPIQVERRIHVK